MPKIDISYLGLGPQAGYRILVDDVGLRILSWKVFHRQPSDHQLQNYTRIFVDFLERLNSIPRKGQSGLYEDVPLRERKSVISSLNIEYGNCNTPRVWRPRRIGLPPLFVKYVGTDDFERFIQKGSFRVGSLVDYRVIPDPKAQDPLEGYCSLYFRNRDNHTVLSAFGGENLYLFCGTNALDSDYMQEKFGKVQLVLKDIKGFGDAMTRCLNAVGWELRPVAYRKEKVWRAPALNQIKLDPASMESWTRCPSTMMVLYQYLMEVGPPGTVFLKPVRYSPERELRFVFRMRKDISKPFWQSINAPELLEFFHVVKPPSC
jgi:hypothetical protein